MGTALQFGVPLALSCGQIDLLIMRLATHDLHLHQAICTAQASSNNRVSFSSLSNFLLASPSVIRFCPTFSRTNQGTRDRAPLLAGTVRQAVFSERTFRKTPLYTISCLRIIEFAHD